MGNNHSKWCPEAILRRWTCHSEEKFTHLSAHGSRPRSRKSSRKHPFLETIEEERLISDDLANAQNSQKQPLPQDTETYPVAQMPPETMQATDVTQPAALMNQNKKEAQVKMVGKRGPRFDGQEQPDLVIVPFAENLMLPNGSAPGKRKSSTEEQVAYCFCNTTESANPEEAKMLKVTVWNADDLTPEDEAIMELEDQLEELLEGQPRRRLELLWNME